MIAGSGLDLDNDDVFEDEKKLDQQDIQWLTYPSTSWEMALLFIKHNTIYKQIHRGEKKGHYAWNGRTRKWDMFDTEGCFKKVALILVLQCVQCEQINSLKNN